VGTPPRKGKLQANLLAGMGVRPLMQLAIAEMDSY